MWLAHIKALQAYRQLSTDRGERNKYFKAHNFKIGQPIVAKNHLRNTFESKFITDYRALEIVNDRTLIAQSPDAKTWQIKVNYAKPVSARAATDTALHDFKQSAMRKEHTYQYQLRSSAAK